MTTGDGTPHNGQQQPAKSSVGWRFALFLPVLGMCFPALYARATPVLFGFPFFYWYQLAWVFLSAILMLIIYRKLRT